MKRLAIAAAAAVGAAAFWGAGIARADMTVRQTVTISGDTQPADGKKASSKRETYTKTVYYKGGKQRTESGDSVTLSTAGSDKLIVLDTTQHTYYELAILPSAPDAARQFGDLISFVGTPSVTDTGEERQIAGKTAHHYKFSIALAPTMKDPNAPPTVTAIYPTLAVSADEWVVPDSSGASARGDGIAMVRRLPADHALGMKPLLEKMAAVKGVAIAATQTFTVLLSPNAPDDVRAQMPKEPFAAESRADSVSDAPLKDDLFTVPEGYKKVAPPQG